MHNRAFVTFERENVETSQQARDYALQFLDGNGFAARGRFAKGPSDWFVIGGRWSGYLQLVNRGIDFYGKVHETLNTTTLSDIEVENNRGMLQGLWQKLGFEGENPYIRNNYKENGYDDDAMLVNQVLYDKVLKEYEGREEDEKGEFWDLEMEEVKDDFICRKWIALVDYHL